MESEFMIRASSAGRRSFFGWMMSRTSIGSLIFVVLVVAVVLFVRHGNWEQIPAESCKMCMEINLRSKGEKRGLTFIIPSEGGKVCPGGKFYGRVPLNYAAECVDKEVVSTLLKSGIPVDTVDREGHTPLMCLVIHWEDVLGKSQDLAEFLVESGADVNMRNPINGWCAIHEAVWSGTPESVEWLLNHGADVDVADQYGRTPLMLSVVRGEEVEILDLLVRNNSAIIRSRDNRGWYAIHFATESANERAIEWIIKHGGDINSRGFDGKTPLDIANESHHPKIVTFLTKIGAVSGVPNEPRTIEVSP